MDKISLNNESIGRVLASDYDDTIEVTRLNLQRGATGMMNEMEEFLNTHYSSGQRFGFEVAHIDSETTFNIFTNQYKYESTASRFVDIHGETGSFSVPDHDFIPLESGKVLTAFEFELEDDYWIPTDTYQNKQRDPLSKIISEMDSRENIDYLFQVVADPIPDSTWSQRYPLSWMLSGYLTDVYASLSEEVQTLREKQNIYTRLFYSGFSIMNLTKSVLFDLPLKWMNGMTHKAFENSFIQSGQLKQNIDQKVRQNGYATKIRLVAVSDTKDNLEKRVPDVLNTIMEISRSEYTNSDNKVTTVQQLSPTQDNGVETIAARVYGRHGVVSPTGQFREDQSYKLFKNKRTEPVILSPNELAVYMHHVNNPTHDSIKFN